MMHKGIPTDFLDHILKTTASRCGQSFDTYINHLKQERKEAMQVVDGNLRSVNDQISPDHQIFKEIEFDTIVIQATNFLGNEDYGVLLYELAVIAFRYGEYIKAERLLKSVLSIYSQAIRPTLLGKAHELLGDTFMNRNKLEDARHQYWLARDLFQNIDFPEGRASCINALGILKIEECDSTSEAIGLFEEAQEIARSAASEELEFRAILNLANVHIILGNYELAAKLYTGLLSRINTANAPNLRARIQYNLAIVRKYQNDYAAASQLLDEVINTLEDDIDSQLQALVYLLQAELSYFEQDFTNATGLVMAAFHIFRACHDRYGQADVYKVLGMINRETGKQDLAYSYFLNSLKINSNHSCRLNAGETHFELGKYHQNLDNIEHAIESYSKALACFEQVEATIRIAETRSALAALPAI